MDDFIGGRYSSTSAVGGAILSLAFGPEIFARFLKGAAEEDKLAANKNLLIMKQDRVHEQIHLLTFHHW